MALLNWRVWAVIGIAITLALVGAGAYRAGKKHVQAAWDAEKVVQVKAAAEAEVENRRIETKRQTGVINAQNQANRRNADLLVDSGRSRAVVDSLRDTIRTTTASLPSRPAAATSAYAATSAELLVECSTAYSEVATKTDGHASDSLMLQQAWSK